MGGKARLELEVGRRIIAAIDLSESSRLVLKYAALLAQSSDRRLVMLHVVGDGDVGDALVKMRLMQAELGVIDAHTAQNAELCVLRGDPACVLPELVNEAKDALLVGRTGGGGASCIGSVAARVALHSRAHEVESVQVASCADDVIDVLLLRPATHPPALRRRRQRSQTASLQAGGGSGGAESSLRARPWT